MSLFVMQKYSLCRLCLCAGGNLMDIFDASAKSEFVIEEAIRDLLQFQVVREIGFPWMMCFTCLEKLSEFRIFKIRCRECKAAFENRFSEEGMSNWDEEIRKEDKVPVKEEICETVLDEPGGDVKIDPEDEPSSPCEEPHYELPKRIVPDISPQQSFVGSPKGVKDALLSIEYENALPFGYVEHYKARERDQKFSESNDFLCRTCGEVLPSNDAFSAHLRLHDQEGDEFGADLDVAGTSETKGVNQIKEDSFPAEFEVVSENIAAKPAKKRRSRSRRCKFCKEMFQHIVDYNNHILIHADEKLYGCTVCSRRFNQRYSLTCHMRIHNNEKPYKCDYCDKAFRRQPNLRSHIRIHTGDKPYCCEICGRRFAQYSSLITHTRGHKGIKAFKCDSCDKSFIHSYDLKIHQKRHTGIKNFGCDTCGRFFYEKHLLRFHIMTHIDERPMKCTICDKGFTKKDFLVTHMRRHTGETPYQCKDCGKRYKWLSNYKYHLKLHERENAESAVI